MARSIEVVGKLFTTPEEFLLYLQSLKWGVWRPKYVTVHHCGSPDLKIWNGWQTRKPPVTDEQWLRNLGVYYANPAYDVKGRMYKPAWDVGPHFFVTPKHIGVLTPPTQRGIHAASFNHNSWGVEIVGNFDVEKFDGLIRDLTIEALAAMHVALGIESDAKFVRGTSGLHFHRDDPKTNKTCPGKNVQKLALVKDIKAVVAALTDSTPDTDKTLEHPQEVIKPAVKAPKLDTIGVVAAPIDDPVLNVRVSASARAPVVRTLGNGHEIVIEGVKMNGTTMWLDIGDDEWVSAQYILVGGKPAQSVVRPEEA